MAFAIEHQEEPPESVLNSENSNYFTYQPWTRYNSNSTQSNDRIKALIQYRQFDWSIGIQPGLRPLEIDSESDEEVQPTTLAEELLAPSKGYRPTKRGLDLRIDKKHFQALDPYFQETELGFIVESAITRFLPSNYQVVSQTFWEDVRQFKVQSNHLYPVSSIIYSKGWQGLKNIIYDIHRQTRIRAHVGNC
eukprot:13410232-Heterocapsa_arctica.AAC.1